MNLETFELERFQSTWENQVEINISESGVHPVSVDELLRLAYPDPRVKSRKQFIHRLLQQELGYSQTNGTISLRKKIAKLYPGAANENIEVTNGGSEANFITMWRLVEPGDGVVVMLPNYMQVWGLGRALKARVKPWWLRQVGRPGQLEWAPDVGELKELVTKRTKLIAICNPNNPTGAVLSLETMNAVVEFARRVGSWILADEVYQGAELEGNITPSFWSIGGSRKAPYEKLTITNSLSKVYGLPGLRIGGLVGAREASAASWAAHDYTTIGPGAINDALAALALSSTTRRAIFARNRKILQA